MKSSVVKARVSLLPALSPWPTELRWLVVALACATGTACGQKGPLRLPDEARPSATPTSRPSATSADAAPRPSPAAPPPTAASSPRP